MRLGSTLASTDIVCPQATPTMSPSWTSRLKSSASAAHTSFRSTSRLPTTSGRMVTRLSPKAFAIAFSSSTKACFGSTIEIFTMPIS